MGCPVPKVRKTGAGVALLENPDLRRRGRASDRRRGERRRRPESGDGVAGIPVTVKLRSGLRPGEHSGFELAHRLVAEAGVAAIGFHPRSAAVHHKGAPDYELAARLVESLPAPVILTGGMDDADAAREAFASTGAAAIMLARGALGNPWLFAELLGPRLTGADPAASRCWPSSTGRSSAPSSTSASSVRRAICASSTPGMCHACSSSRSAARGLQESLQTADTLVRVRELLDLARRPLPLAA